MNRKNNVFFAVSNANVDEGGVEGTGGSKSQICPFKSKKY